jgi:hypothetical protein
MKVLPVLGSSHFLGDQSDQVLVCYATIGLSGIHMMDDAVGTIQSAQSNLDHQVEMATR